MVNTKDGGTTLVNPILEVWKLRHSDSKLPVRIIELKGCRAGIQTLSDAPDLITYMTFSLGLEDKSRG